MNLEDQEPIPVSPGVEMPDCDHRWVRELHRFTRCARCGATLRPNPVTGLNTIYPMSEGSVQETTVEPVLTRTHGGQVAPLPRREKAGRVDAALRAERKILGHMGWTYAANAINSYLQNADEDSKARFYDLLTNPK
jgi:hypothetical protein